MTFLFLKKNTCIAESSFIKSLTVNFLNIWTPKKCVVITLKFERCRRNGKQCRPWSDCSSRSSLIWVCTVFPGLSVRKLRIIMVYCCILYKYVNDDFYVHILWQILPLFQIPHCKTTDGMSAGVHAHATSVPVDEQSTSERSGVPGSQGKTWLHIRFPWLQYWELAFHYQVTFYHG